MTTNNYNSFDDVPGPEDARVRSESASRRSESARRRRDRRRWGGTGEELHHTLETSCELLCLDMSGELWVGDIWRFWVETAGLMVLRPRLWPGRTKHTPKKNWNAHIYFNHFQFPIFPAKGPLPFDVARHDRLHSLQKRWWEPMACNLWFWGHVVAAAKQDKR